MPIASRTKISNPQARTPRSNMKLIGGFGGVYKGRRGAKLVYAHNILYIIVETYAKVVECTLSRHTRTYVRL